MQAKIRTAELQKVPYILVVGDKEVSSNAVGVREHGKGDRGILGINDLILELQTRAEQRN
jgi:threonyl-tRNA synthetase